MKEDLLEINKMSYIILLRELVCQLNEAYIYSGNYSSSVFQLDFKLFPKCIQDKYTLSKLNTNSKVNINYITKKMDNNERFINPILFDILINTKYIRNNKGNECLKFRTHKDFVIFNIMKSFKSVNADFFDVGNLNLKKALKSYKATEGYNKIPFNKDFSEELGPNSLILITPEEEIIYSNRVLISFDDFFIFNNDIDSIKLNKLDKIKEKIFSKLQENKVYKYSSIKKDLIFNDLFLNINKDIEKHYNKFQIKIKDCYSN